MNKRIDFTSLGGAPITQDTLQFLQDSYRNAFKGLAGFIGDKVIVSGMEEVGGNVTDGWLVYNGELIPFVGGAMATDIVVIETPTAVLFEDNNSHDFYFEKVAQFGGPATFAYADLKRKASGICDMKPWPGQIAKIPFGWYQCDGSLKNIADFPEAYDLLGTLHGGDGVTTFALPNLKKKVIAGYDATDADYDTVGKTGGSKSHVVTKDNIQAFDVHLGGANSTSGAANIPVNGTGPGDGDITVTVGVATPTAIDHRDEFITMPYIIKLK